VQSVLLLSFLKLSHLPFYLAENQGGHLQLNPALGMTSTVCSLTVNVVREAGPPVQ
jgi:hypothetical protein